eukprot:COSAG04_NODE_2922_length_3381_cov_62.270871_2_plen_143_part_00
MAAMTLWDEDFEAAATRQGQRFLDALADAVHDPAPPQEALREGGVGVGSAGAGGLTEAALAAAAAAARGHGSQDSGSISSGSEAGHSYRSEEEESAQESAAFRAELSSWGDGGPQLRGAPPLLQPLCLPDSRMRLYLCNKEG